MPVLLLRYVPMDAKRVTASFPGGGSIMGQMVSSRLTWRTSSIRIFRRYLRIMKAYDRDTLLAGRRPAPRGSLLRFANGRKPGLAKLKPRRADQSWLGSTMCKCMIEGPGHVRFALTRRYGQAKLECCDRAPFPIPPGPLTTDIAPGLRSHYSGIWLRR